jgi:2'-5' RNA ligase
MGQGPYVGRISPLVQQLSNERGYANVYGGFLPRPASAFTEGAFAPFSPIMPVPVDSPPDGFERPRPRRYQYDVGFNLPTGDPGSEGGYKLAPFSALKALGKSYSIARRCIQFRKLEICGLNWDITMTSAAEKAYQGDRVAMRDFGERRAKAMKFWRRPDPRFFSFMSWLGALLEQVMVTDAASLYFCPKKGRGMGKGLLGSDLDSLWLIDGATIRPLVDLHGGPPLPPAPAYQAYYYGVPRADFTQMVDDQDLAEAGLGEGDIAARCRGDQLLYLPSVPMVDSPYGFSMVEQCITPIMTGLAKQGYQLDFFREGTVPAVYISPGDTSMTPNQIRELQDALNAVAGDIAFRWKVIVLPPGSKTMPQKPGDIVDQADEWIANEVCMTFGVSPMDVGILPKVSTVASPFAAREMAQSSRTTNDRVDTTPMLRYLAEIPNYILQVFCGQDDMEFSFEGQREIQDEAALTDMLVKQAQIGVRSVDEFRDKIGLPPWGVPESSGPVVFTPMGPIPLDEAVALASATAQQKALPPGPSPGGKDGKKPAATARSLPGGSVPARQRQRGGAALTPAHAAAEGFMPERRRGATAGSAGPAHPQASVKGALAELEALTRHLRRGREITSWEARYLPPRALSVIAEQMARGMDAGQAADVAKTLVLPPASYQWAEKAQHRQETRQQQARALEAKYAAQIQAALAAAAAAAAALIAQWAAGTLAVTAAVLAAMIAAEILRHLRAVLERLWREAWRAGEKEGGGRETAALEAFLATWGRQVGEWVSRTGTDEIARRLRDLAGLKRKRLIAELLRLLEADERAPLIAASEVTRAWNAALLAIWRLLGVTDKGWRIADESACATCKKNQAQGWIPLTALFQSGDPAPGAHPRCRCHLVRRRPPPAAGKARRRGVNLDGEVVLSDDPEGENPAGGGGRTLYPHRADGTEVPGGVPGSSAGGAPPRWDASAPERRGYVNGYGEDDADWPDRGLGVPAGPGEDFPGSDQDEDRWPEGGHGTAQAGTSSPGGDGPRGRAPNAMGKAADAAARFLKDAPRAKAGVVYRQMLENFPPEALTWVKDKSVRWVGPVGIPADLLDFANAKEWAAHHQQGKVDSFARKIKAGGHVNPIIGVVKPGHGHVRIPDGRHRASACKKLGRPVPAYVAFVDHAGPHPSDRIYLQQEHSGADPANKSFTAGAAAGGTTSGLTPLTVQGQACSHCGRPDGREDGCPGAARAVSGYELSPRSGMISLDLPEDLIEPLPGGVSDSHVTVVYLGRDVGDESFDAACERARSAAAAAPGPLVGMLAGVGTFPPSGSSDGRVPVFIPARIPGADGLRAALADLSASEHHQWSPHVTLAYLEPGDPLPGPHPPVPVAFTHLSVHRGDDIERFPLGGGHD